jgi:hypothetical protein
VKRSVSRIPYAPSGGNRNKPTKKPTQVFYSLPPSCRMVVLVNVVVLCIQLSKEKTDVTIDHFMHYILYGSHKKGEYCAEEEGGEQKKNYIEDYSNIINTAFSVTHDLFVAIHLVLYGVRRVW